jgi:HSP20 family protein
MFKIQQSVFVDFYSHFPFSGKEGVPKKAGSGGKAGPEKKEGCIMILNRVTRWPGWTLRTPQSDLERLRQEMDRLMGGLDQGIFRTQGAGVFPLVNLTEDKDRFYLRAELPGIQASDVDISATAKTLTISGERKIPSEEETARYHRREREAGRFSRVISMPDAVNPAGIEAECKDGVLTITIPKAEEAKPRQISIKTS